MPLVDIVPHFKRPPFKKRWHQYSQATADNIYLYLKQKQLSIEEFASKLNVSNKEVEKWLSGTYNFDLNTIVKIQFEFDGKNDVYKREILIEKYDA